MTCTGHTLKLWSSQDSIPGGTFRETELAVDSWPIMEQWLWPARTGVPWLVSGRRRQEREDKMPYIPQGKGY